MEFLEVIERRATVLLFKDEAVPLKFIKEWVRSAGMAPSLNNAQPWRYLAILNPNRIDKIEQLFSSRQGELLPEPALPEAADAGGVRARSRLFFFSRALRTAPALIAVAMAPYESTIDPALDPAELTSKEVEALRGHPELAVGASIQNFLLAATNSGYTTAWVSGPFMARDELEAYLELSPPWRLASLIAVGRSDGSYNPRPKKTFEEIFELLS